MLAKALSALGVFVPQCRYVTFNTERQCLVLVGAETNARHGSGWSEHRGGVTWSSNSKFILSDLDIVTLRYEVSINHTYNYV